MSDNKVRGCESELNVCILGWWVGGLCMLVCAYYLHNPSSNTEQVSL